MRTERQLKVPSSLPHLLALGRGHTLWCATRGLQERVQVSWTAALASRPPIPAWRVTGGDKLCAPAQVEAHVREAVERALDFARAELRAQQGTQQQGLLALMPPTASPPSPLRLGEAAQGLRAMHACMLLCKRLSHHHHHAGALPWGTEKKLLASKVKLCPVLAKLLCCHQRQQCLHPLFIPSCP